MMTRQISFRGCERRILPKFRERLNKASSTGDVKKAFAHTVEKLLNDVFEGRVTVEAEDVVLVPDAQSCYRLSGRLRADKVLEPCWSGSDLPHVIHRFAESAAGRYKHLEKHPEKTESKIRM